MVHMKVALLTSKNQWFCPYAKDFAKRLKAPLFYEYEQIVGFDIVFILSYHKIIPLDLLKQNALNLVIHASNLPLGKGWSPLFWQVIEGKKDIVFTLFKADENGDNGDIYLQKTLHLNGLELYDELREKQAKLSFELCLEFLQNYPGLKAKKQSGIESFYQKRSPKDSELKPNLSLNEQFNLLRTCDNENFPAFFYKNGKKFIIKIYAENGGGGGSILVSPFLIIKRRKCG